MKEIEQNVLNHIPDSPTKGVLKNRIADKTNRLMMLNREVRTCNPQTENQ